MTNIDRSAIDVAIALLCLVLVALVAVLYVLCRKKFAAVDPAAGEGKASTSGPILPAAHFHQLSDMETATAGFHGSRVVGCGRLGTVYKAEEADGGRGYSVKRIHHHLVLGNPGMSFSSRMKSLSYACHHPNVVPVLGFSEAPGERLIISEFVGETSCSLEHYLKQGSAVLGWAARLRIATGAARGIEHLHDASVPGVVHGCVKPSNILVDAGLCSRVCDYGLSFLMEAVDRAREMEGYVDWEGGGACKENDVYAFGVVLLELLSGRRCNGGRLADWALALMREDRTGEVLDARVAAPRDVRSLLRMMKVAAACVGNGRKTRPAIAQVAAILSSLEAQPISAQSPDEVSNS
ncbi:serine/threonine-protein kinase-like protein CCR1 [Zingiber officinale]|uniref:Protein kinase domain-containing protein n=1 Tax=Zingiber officinale TaxID=94328 RepID=A0A8J5IL18_ZINOF|nr:serine/threonine-protein kinase-like protein CCR1 [Zingiber officinale]KAG6535973.1 hypothetical protein ZIOFF_001008 [Zingiber officinale]